MANIYSKLLARVSGSGRLTTGRIAEGPRGLIGFADAYIVEHFGRLGYSVTYDQLVFTTESVADFVEARDTIWHKPGSIVDLDIAGLMVVENAQPRADQPTRDVAVVSLGNARVVMGVLYRKERVPARYAAEM
ncbi:MAG: hypothetical protein JWO15_3903 [Sphingomonadales bacterium]|nr:hypothetical protein [Sphingomonadales bacterium]